MVQKYIVIKESGEHAFRRGEIVKMDYLRNESDASWRWYQSIETGLRQILEDDEIEKYGEDE